MLDQPTRALQNCARAQCIRRILATRQGPSSATFPFFLPSFFTLRLEFVLPSPLPRCLVRGSPWR